MKEVLGKHKKLIISSACVIVSLIIIVIIAFFATASFAESSSIGKQNAENFAFVDAGIDPIEAKKLKTEFEFKNGQFIYDVEFESNGTEYEYWIKASNGSIIKKEADVSDEFVNQKEQENNNQVVENEVKNELSENIEKNTTENNNNTESSNSKTNNNTNSNTSNKTESSKETNTTNIISLDSAKIEVLTDAKVSASKCTFTKAKLELDDGIQIYDMEFHTADNEYEYEVDAKTGAILNKEIEPIKKNKSTSSPTTTAKPSNNNSSYIGVDKAKSIALNHAGVSNVTFEKAKLDRENGKTVYEIEFYKDRMEYSYEIDALTGKILDYDKDYDD